MSADIVRNLEDGAFFIRPNIVRLADHSLVHYHIERVCHVRNIPAR